MRGLADWLDDPAPDQTVSFATDDGGWDDWSYTQLAGAAGAVAGDLRDAGLRTGDVVSIVAPSSPDFIAAFYGVLAAGGTPSPLVPPTYFADRGTYLEHTAPLIQVASQRVLAHRDLLDVVGDAVRMAGAGGEPLPIRATRDEPKAIQREEPAELALLQFTSGSTGRPRGVRVTWRNLELHLDMILNWISWEPEESGATWLPLYHDMGLVGCVLLASTYQRSGCVFRPDQFVRWPQRWLDCFGRRDAVFTAAPNFAFAYAAKRVREEDLEGSDFSRFRAAIIGAERLDPGALGKFAARLEPYGFRRETFLPAYGLAEATLAVSGVPIDRVARAVRPRWDSLEIGKKIDIEESAILGDPRIGDGAGWLVGCGAPVRGVSVSVVDEAGDALPDGCFGEIVVRGETVADGYFGTDPESATAFADGSLRTGDAGFHYDGDWYVAGRIGDAVKVFGRTVYAEDLEGRLMAIPGVPKGRCVVIPNPLKNQAGVTVIVEGEPGEWVDQAWSVLRRTLGAEADNQVLVGGPGTILHTSSGKPRRRAMWRALVAGELPAEPAYPTALADSRART